MVVSYDAPALELSCRSAQLGTYFHLAAFSYRRKENVSGFSNIIKALLSHV